MVPDTLAFLLGTWRVERAIDDHRASTRGRFEGTARLVATETAVRGGGGPARYDEDGEVRFGSHAGRARRKLEFRPFGTGAVMVHFADGRPFVDLDLRRGAWEATHLCGDDRYEITTLVVSTGAVEERWRVSGPAKDYEAVTVLRRTTSPAGSPSR